MTNEITADVTYARARPRRPRMLVVALSFASLFAAVVQAVVVPILPDMAREFNVSIAAVSWTVTAGLATAAAVVPVFGRLADMRSGRGMLLLALALITVGGVVSGLASDLAPMIIGRTLQGAAGVILPLAITIASVELAGPLRTTGVAAIAAGLGVGGGLGPVLAGLLMRIISDFRAVLWMTAVMGAVALLLAVVFIPARTSRFDLGVRFDVMGAVLLSAGVLLVLVPLSKATDWGWGSPQVLVGATFAVPILCLFAAVEKRRPNGLIDINLLQSKPILSLNLISALVGGLMYILMLGISLLARTEPSEGYGFGATPLETAVDFLLPITAGAVVASPIGVRLVARFSGRTTMILAGVIGSLGLTLLSLGHERQALVTVGAIAGGIAISLSYVASPILVRRFTPASKIGMANSANALFRWIGGAAASSIFAAVTMSLTGQAGSAVPWLLFLPGVLASVAIVSVGVFGLPRKDRIRTRSDGASCRAR
ncbi:MAG: MFS transporter [Alcaligenaceae bacterium]|nr:MAG: MFS transporter [Alcaligenaceae bacterium]